MTMVNIDDTEQHSKGGYAAEPSDSIDTQTSTATNRKAPFRNFREYFQSDLYRVRQRQLDAKC